MKTFTDSVREAIKAQGFTKAFEAFCLADLDESCVALRGRSVADAADLIIRAAQFANQPHARWGDGRIVSGPQR